MGLYYLKPEDMKGFFNKPIDEAYNSSNIYVGSNKVGPKLIAVWREGEVLKGSDLPVDESNHRDLPDFLKDSIDGVMLGNIKE